MKSVIFSLLVSSQLFFVNASGFAQVQSKQAQTKVKEQQEMLLYGTSVSPFVRKVQIALAEKGVSYQQKAVLPTKLLIATGQKPEADFVQVSPLGKIPAIKDAEFSLADSDAIGKYLDLKYPQTKLYPKTPKEYGQVIYWERYVDEVVAPIVNPGIVIEKIVKPVVLKLKSDEVRVQQVVRDQLPPVFETLENQLKHHSWIGGDQFSMADISLGSILYGIEMAKVSVSWEKWPHLDAYLKKLFSRASFKDALKSL